MSEYTVKAEQLSLPLIALEDVVAFPGEIVNLELTDKRFGSSDAAREAFESTKYAVAVPVVCEGEGESQLATVGAVVRVKQIITTGDGNVRMIAEGMSRAIINDFAEHGREKIHRRIHEQIHHAAG